jgi:hypothetical protein
MEHVFEYSWGTYTFYIKFVKFKSDKLRYSLLAVFVQSPVLQLSRDVLTWNNNNEYF